VLVLRLRTSRRCRWCNLLLMVESEHLSRPVCSDNETADVDKNWLLCRIRLKLRSPVLVLSASVGVSDQFWKNWASHRLPIWSKYQLKLPKIVGSDANRDSWIVSWRPRRIFLMAVAWFASTASYLCSMYHRLCTRCRSRWNFFLKGTRRFDQAVEDDVEGSRLDDKIQSSQSPRSAPIDEG
jgi:hypothetical protein